MVDAILHSTKGIKPEQTLDYWRHSALPGADIRLHPQSSPPSFQAERSFAPTRTAAFIDTRCRDSSFTVERTLRHIRQDGQDQVTIAMMRHGTAVHDHVGQAHTLGVGDLLIGDRARPVRLATAGSYEEIRLQFPRALFRSIVGDPEPLAGRLFKAGNPLVDLIYHYGQDLRCRIAGMADMEAEAAFQAMLVLVRGLTDAAGAPADARSPSRPDVTIDAVRAYILRRLDDPALDVDEIVERLRISRTRLYEVLKPCGGVRALIKDTRLDRIHAALSAGAQDTIGTIANTHGFPDQNTFTRAFRNRFGRTPSQVREEAKDRLQRA
jgi:AraC family transcriptional activator of tynA and feaB